MTTTEHPLEFATVAVPRTVTDSFEQERHEEVTRLARGQGRTTWADIPQRYRDAAPDLDGVRDYVRALVGTADRKSSATSYHVGVGPSLLLLGPTGTGKTWQAYGAIRALTTSGATCAWRATTAADLYAAMRPRPGIDPEFVFGEYARTGLLLLDDLGAAKATEWTEEVTYRIITHRYDRQKPMIVTSNLAPKRLMDALGERVASRLFEMSTTVVMDGPSRRTPR